MNMLFLVWLVSLAITIAACWYRDNKYPYDTTHHDVWSKSVSHRIALIAFVITLSGLALFLFMYFKDTWA